MTKKILITGGAGFIGSNYAQLVSENHPDWQIIIVDALTYAGDEDGLKDIKHDFEHADIADETRIDEIFKKYNPDYIVNFAAETHVDRSILGPSVFVETNIRGTFNLLEAAKKYNAERYLQISTDEVYGDLGDNSTAYFTEDTPIDPNCPYAASKASADILVRSYFETFSLPVLITRCTNNYGPRQFPEKLIPFFIFKALNDEKLPIYGDGKNIRDWLYVKDHCRAIDLVLTKGKIGEVYNIGGHNEKTNLEITKILLEKLNKPETLIDFVTDRLAHDRRYAMDASKIKKELNWEPEFPFEVWIDETIDWYLNNKDWVKKVALKAKNFHEENYSLRKSLDK